MQVPPPANTNAERESTRNEDVWSDNVDQNDWNGSETRAQPSPLKA